MMYVVRAVDPMGMIPLVSFLCYGVCSLIRHDRVRMRPSVRPWMAEAFMGRKSKFTSRIWDLFLWGLGSASSMAH